MSTLAIPLGSAMSAHGVTHHHGCSVRGTRGAARERNLPRAVCSQARDEGRDAPQPAPARLPLRGRTQARVAARGQHLDHAAAQLQQRHVPGATAQVQHEHRLVLLGRHAVRERGRDGLPAARAWRSPPQPAASACFEQGYGTGRAPKAGTDPARCQACQLGSRNAWQLWHTAPQAGTRTRIRPEACLASSAAPMTYSALPLAPLPTQQRPRAPDEANHLQAGQAPGGRRRLALRLSEIRRHLPPGPQLERQLLRYRPAVI